jgi:hypothetical protein
MISSKCFRLWLNAKSIQICSQVHHFCHSLSLELINIGNDKIPVSNFNNENLAKAHKLVRVFEFLSLVETFPALIYSQNFYLDKQQSFVLQKQNQEE